jgi:hypothetical protein
VDSSSPRKNSPHRRIAPPVRPTAEEAGRRLSPAERRDARSRRHFRPSAERVHQRDIWGAPPRVGEALAPSANVLRDIEATQAYCAARGLRTPSQHVSKAAKVEAQQQLHSTHTPRSRSRRRSERGSSRGGSAPMSGASPAQRVRARRTRSVSRVPMTPGEWYDELPSPTSSTRMAEGTPPAQDRGECSQSSGQSSAKRNLSDRFDAIAARAQATEGMSPGKAAGMQVHCSTLRSGRNTGAPAVGRGGGGAGDLGGRAAPGRGGRHAAAVPPVLPPVPVPPPMQAGAPAVGPGGRGVPAGEQAAQECTVCTCLQTQLAGASHRARSCGRWAWGGRE